MGQSECRPCSTADPNSDIVKVDATLLTQPQDVKPEQEAFGACSPGTAEAERRRLEEQLAAEEQVRQMLAATEAAERSEREEAELAEIAEREAAERAALEMEAVAHAEAEARLEEERRAADLARQRAEEQVGIFLRARGFKSIAAPRKKCFVSSFPLHAAVEENSAEIVRALLMCGADGSRKNSAGKTPREWAVKLNKRGSHEEVIAALSL